jgi:hypothetical protein
MVLPGCAIIILHTFLYDRKRRRWKWRMVAVKKKRDERKGADTTILYDRARTR